MNIPILIDDQWLEEFCQRHYIRQLAFFGSVLRDDFNEASDIDILVEFEEGHMPGWDIVAMEDELTGFFGRQVDFRTYAELSPRFRDKMPTEIIYAKP